MVKDNLFSVKSINMLYFSCSLIFINCNNLSGFCCTAFAHVFPYLLSCGQLKSSYKMNRPITKENNHLCFITGGHTVCLHWQVSLSSLLYETGSSSWGGKTVRNAPPFSCPTRKVQGRLSCKNALCREALCKSSTKINEALKMKTLKNGQTMPFLSPFDKTHIW